MYCYTRTSRERVEGTILVLGDSISNDGRYVSFINTYIRLYLPGESIVINNFGVSSETLSGLSEPDHPFPRPCLFGRLERILDEVKPDWVIACYGINDAIYYPFSEERFAAYREGWKRLADRIHKTGARLAAMTPPPFDAAAFAGNNGGLLPDGAEKYSYMEAYENYDEVMERYSRFVMEEVDSDLSIDLYSALSADRTALRAADPQAVTGDGIHPDVHGHLVIARLLLKELFGFTTNDFAKAMENDHYTLLGLMHEYDSLFHASDIETIGHDNLFKLEYMTGEVLMTAADRKARKITDYIKGHNEFYLQKDEWSGFCREHFHFEGYEALIVYPRCASGGRPWVWRTEFFGAFAQADAAMADAGWHLVHLAIPDQFGGPDAVLTMARFQLFMEKTYSLREKTVLFGFSRGGLYALHYAAAYPDRVAALYLDAPVADISSWPGGKGRGCGSVSDWRMCLLSFGLTPETASEYICRLEYTLKRVTEARLPLILVAGDCDEAVPYEENGAKLETVYRAADVPFQVIMKPGIGHHPHSLENPVPIVEFLFEHAGE